MTQERDSSVLCVKTFIDEGSVKTGQRQGIQVQ